MESVTFVVQGRDPEALVQCLRIVGKARRHISRYARINLLFDLTSSECGIVVEEEGFVDCFDEDYAIDRLIELTASVIAKRKLVGIAMAAGVEV